MYESMSDIVGSPYDFNPVTHTKLILRGGDGNGGTFVSSLTPGQVLIPLSGLNHDLSTYPTPSVSASVVQEFAWDAFFNATTQIPHEVELPNFILELGDLKSIFKMPANLWQLYKNGQLTWDFAIKPMISDLKALAGTVASLKKRIAFLKKSYGKVTPIRFRREVEFEIDVGTVPDSYYQDSFLGFDITHLVVPQHVVLRSHQAILYSTIKIRHYIEGLDSLLGQLDALAAALGMNNLINTAWNAIPFSFVFEWFVNIQAVLDSFAVPPFKGKIDVIESSFSVKQRFIYQAYTENANDINPSLLYIFPESAGYITGSSYVRRRGLPLDSMIFQEDGLTDHQKLLLGLLISK
jgi:hypothetical protein